MIGTLVNTGAILAGSLAGLAAGGSLPERIKQILMQALGLAVVAIGLQMALSGSKPILTIGCLLLGGLTGELIGIEGRLERCAVWLKGVIRSGSSTFVEGFVSASLLYLVGAMTILGTIQDGISKDPGTLYVKSVLDGVASLALASSLGVGVAFSSVSVFVVQGLMTLTASRLLFLQRPEVLSAVTATGGLLILGIGITLLDLRKIRTGNLLPSLFYAIGAALVF